MSTAQADAISSETEDLEVPITPNTPQRLLKLMKEYSEKMDAMRAIALQIHARGNTRQSPNIAKLSGIELAELQSRFHEMEPMIVEIIQRAAGQIEHIRLDDLTRLEMRIRSTEIEHAYETTKLLMKDLPTKL